MLGTGRSDAASGELVWKRYAVAGYVAALFFSPDPRPLIGCTKPGVGFSAVVSLFGA